jgi:hypothetical protein
VPAFIVAPQTRKIPFRRTGTGFRCSPDGI